MTHSKREKLDKSLNEIIGIEYELDNLDDDPDGERVPRELELVEYDKVESKVPAEARQSDVYDDYEYTRSILRGLLVRGTSALEKSLMLAQESEHPRAFEVSSTLMKNVADISKDLMNIHKSLEESNSGGGGTKPKTQTNIQNNYYGGGNTEQKDIDRELDDLDDDETEDN